jgi:hypothetical protein
MATLQQQQDDGYALLWQRYDNKMAAMRYYGNVMTSRIAGCLHADRIKQKNNKLIIHIQQQKYSHVIDLFYIFNCTFVD